MQRKNKQKKNRFSKFEFSWNYLGKPTVKKKMSLDELIAEWEKYSRERLRQLEK